MTMILEGREITLTEVTFNEKMKMCRIKAADSYGKKFNYYVHGDAFFPFEQEGVDRMTIVEAKLVEKYGV